VSLNNNNIYGTRDTSIYKEDTKFTVADDSPQKSDKIKISMLSG
jgi:hypothetical protein